MSGPPLDLCASNEIASFSAHSPSVIDRVRHANEGRANPTCGGRHPPGHHAQPRPYNGSHTGRQPCRQVHHSGAAFPGRERSNTIASASPQPSSDSGTFALSRPIAGACSNSDYQFTDADCHAGATGRSGSKGSPAAGAVCRHEESLWLAGQDGPGSRQSRFPPVLPGVPRCRRQPAKWSRLHLRRSPSAPRGGARLLLLESKRGQAHAPWFQHACLQGYTLGRTAVAGDHLPVGSGG